MHPHLRAGLALAAIAAVLAGCGGSSKSSGGTSASGEASKPPAQILSDTQAALRQARSVQIQGTVAVSGHPATVSLGVESPGKLNVSIAQGAATAAIVVLGNDAYVKANATFYRQQANVPSAALPIVADRWVKTSASGVNGIGSLAKDADLRTLSRCLGVNHGTLGVSGSSSVNGQPAVVLVDKGDLPGSTPGQVYVASSGPPLPLRLVATGKTQPGGVKDAQCSGSPTSPGDTLTFTNYNRPLNISAPAGALSLPG